MEIAAFLLLHVRDLKLPPEPQSIVGYYYVTGKDTGDDYIGICSITKTGHGYVVFWYNGPNAFMGAGIRTGDTFHVGWSVGKKQAVHTYRIKSGKSGPRLVGLWFWVMDTQGGVHVPKEFNTETMEFLKGRP